MKLPHDGEHPVHLRCGPRVLAPVPPAERDLGNLLAGAEAVIRGAAWKALSPEIVVNAAPKAGLQVRAGMPGGLIDREIGRSGERWCDTAQSEAACAVSTQDPVPAAGGSPPRINCFAQCLISGAERSALDVRLRPGDRPGIQARCARAREDYGYSVTGSPSCSVLGWQGSWLPTGHVACQCPAVPAVPDPVRVRWGRPSRSAASEPEAGQAARLGRQGHD